MQQETASRHNKEHKKKRPASRNYPCHTHFSRKTTISCQGLADNLNLPVQSNHQTQHNYTDPSHFFSRCRACPTEEEAQHPIKRLYKAMYNVEGNKCFQEQLLWRLKKKCRGRLSNDKAKTMPSYTHFYPPVFLPDFSHWQLFCNANRLHLNFWQHPPPRDAPIGGTKQEQI